MFEALSSGGATEFPLPRPQVTIIQDYSLPLERYDDYEDDEGELRAESNLAEKFGESPNTPPPHHRGWGGSGPFFSSSTFRCH